MGTATTESAESDVQRIARVAGVLSYRDLPQHLRAEADRFLVAHAEKLPALLRECHTEPPDDAVVAWEVGLALEHALFLIACFDLVPPLEAAGDDRAVAEAFGLGTNLERKAAMSNPAHPLCLPFYLWSLLRHHEARKGESRPAPRGAQWPMAQRWAAMGCLPAKLPPEFDAWFATDEAGKHYQDWRARRERQTEITTEVGQ